MDHMSGTMDTLGSSTEKMSSNVGKMTSTTNQMSDAITGMKPAIYDMAASTNNMQRDFWSMNKNISTPLSFMNNFLPWKDDQSLPFQGSRAPLPQSYYAYPAQQPLNESSSDQGMMMPMQQGAPSYYNPAPPVTTPAPSYNPAGMAKSNDQSSIEGSLPLAPISTVTLN